MPTLSVCIPTFNRPEYLMHALRSIIRQVNEGSDLEVCISNNCSTRDYSEVERFIEPYGFIHYGRQAKQVSLDENMHRAASMAAGQYLYFLGDDDFFLEGGLVQLRALIDQVRPDLAIINGVNVTDAGKHISRLFEGGKSAFHTFQEAYAYHHNHCMFGAILVKRAYVIDPLFVAFYGTSHAYLSFWAAIAMRENEGSKNPICVFTPSHPIVALRASQKTYSSYFLDALYLHMPMWYYVLLRFVEDSQARRLIMRIANDNLSLIFSLRFLASLRAAGVGIKPIVDYPPALSSPLVRLKLSLIAHTPLHVLRAAGWALKKIKHLRGAPRATL